MTREVHHLGFIDLSRKEPETVVQSVLILLGLHDMIAETIMERICLRLHMRKILSL